MEALNLIGRMEYISDLSNWYTPRVYKPRIDPFLMPDVQFKKKYRFNKSTVRKIVDLIKTDIMVDKRGNGTSSELQVIVALRCWGRREVQDDCGELHGLDQSTVSRICVKVSRALAKCSQYKIKMPNTLEEEIANATKFKAIQNFPTVIGAIDGTHVKIKKTGGDMAQYYINRKGFYSLNVQAVCDAELIIKTPYLFTPILHPENQKEEKYNVAHIATRNTVERCFGVWKQRFRCLLDGVTVKLKNAKVLIVALAVLHNIALEENDSVPDDVECEEPTCFEMEEYDFTDNSSRRGSSIRRENVILKTFIQKYF